MGLSAFNRMRERQAAKTTEAGADAPALPPVPEREEEKPAENTAGNAGRRGRPRKEN